MKEFDFYDDYRIVDQSILALKWFRKHYLRVYPLFQNWLWDILTDEGADEILEKEELDNLINDRKLVYKAIYFSDWYIIREKNTIIGALRYWQQSGFCNPYNRPDEFFYNEPLAFREINFIVHKMNRCLRKRVLNCNYYYEAWERK